MEAIIYFFEKLNNVQKLSWITICMLLFWIAEGAIPLISLNYKKWKHAKTNLFFLFTSILINAFFGLATVGIFIWLSANEFGLLYLIDWPLWVELILGVMLLDLVAQYFVHFLLHKVSFMWRFHMVHHSDLIVDVTTGTRHHPGDYLMRESFALIAVLIGGIPLAFYIIYRLLTIFYTYFSHANIVLPSVLDHLLSFIFITPNIHKFHHHFERPWTDSNYGNIFSIWDRLFGTFVYKDPRLVTYGLDVLEGQNKNDIAYQLKLPFDKNIKTDY